MTLTSVRDKAVAEELSKNIGNVSSSVFSVLMGPAFSKIFSAFFSV